jgi:hypothetical protein
VSSETDMRAAGPLVVAAGIAVIAAVAVTAQDWSAGRYGDLRAVPLAFGLFIAIGEILRINLPGSRQSAPLAAAGAIAFALLPGFKGMGELDYSWSLVVTVVTLGSVVGAFPGALVGRRMHLDELARRVLTSMLAAALFRPHIADLQRGATGYAWKLGLVMTLVAIAAAVADAVLAAAVRATEEHAPYRTALIDEFRALVGISSAIGATGVLIALAAPKMGYLALPVFAIPLLLTQFSFRRYATIEATYLQTIRSLAKVTEVGGYTETGHSRRVSILSKAVAREMGLSERQLKDLDYAALMHDIGQLSLTDPIPGGATTMVAPVDQRRIAELGAEVIRQAGVLDRAALIVERQADPYRPQRGSQDDTLPLESRIIKAVNAYDDFVGASVETDRKLRALERLQLGIDREYDPDVVDTLARIIERQSEYAY